MELESINLIAGKVLSIYASQLPVWLTLATLFTLMAMWDRLASSPGKTWWRNPGLGTDISYMLIHTLIGSYFRWPAMVMVYLFMSGIMSHGEIEDYFSNGRGPLSTLPFWLQVAVYMLGTDFLLYWIHRGFHRGSLWRFHAIHHSATQVDWTTAFRFHPVNTMLQSSLVMVLMVSLGIKVEVVALVAPIDAFIAVWQHANTKSTLGPLKYVIATPVFHRWHHTFMDEGGDSNFAPTFAFWDVMFGTFYMPDGRLPERFGVDAGDIAEGYVAQLWYPFRQPDGEAGDAPAAATPNGPAS